MDSLYVSAFCNEQHLRTVEGRTELAHVVFVHCKGADTIYDRSH